MIPSIPSYHPMREGYMFPFTDEQTETQRANVAYPRDTARRQQNWATAPNTSPPVQ